MDREHILVYNLIQYCIHDNPSFIEDTNTINKLVKSNISIKYITRVNYTYDNNNDDDNTEENILCIIYLDKFLGSLSLSQLYDFLIDFAIIYDNKDKHNFVFTKIDIILKQIDKKINNDGNLIDKYNKMNDEYNTMKNNIKSLHTRNSELIHQLEKINNDHNKLTDDYNKLIKDYNKLADEYNYYMTSGHKLFD